MRPARVALYVLSLMAFIFGVRSLLGKPLTYSMALLLLSGYAALLVLGAFMPRLGMFADVVHKVDDAEIALLIRAPTDAVARWLSLLEKMQLVATFSVPSGADETVKRVDESPCGHILRVGAANVSLLPAVRGGEEVNLVDIVRGFHTPWFARRMHEAKWSWVTPIRTISANAVLTNPAGGAIVLVVGEPDERVLLQWAEAIREARLSAVTLLAT